MKVIVDAYNILHQMSSKKQPGESERKQFINLLSTYAKRKHLQVIAVFDAGPFLFPSTEEQKGIVIKYSGPHSSADDIIIRLLKQYSGQEIILASSDRELRDYARACGIESLSAAEFIPLLREQKPEKKEVGSHVAVKLSADVNELVDTWLGQAKVGVKYEDAAFEQSPNRQAPAHKESKKERSRSKKIKKL